MIWKQVDFLINKKKILNSKYTQNFTNLKDRADYKMDSQEY